jgi:ketol-acid reductoisomerase
LRLLPRVSRETRANIVKHIDAVGSSEFTREVIAELEKNNPELLQMWHHFAEDQADYVGVMQGFALLYACLLAEAAEERGALH